VEARGAGKRMCLVDCIDVLGNMDVLHRHDGLSVMDQHRPPSVLRFPSTSPQITHDSEMQFGYFCKYSRCGEKKENSLFGPKPHARISIPEYLKKTLDYTTALCL